MTRVQVDDGLRDYSPFKYAWSLFENTRDGTVNRMAGYPALGRVGPYRIVLLRRMGFS